MRLDIIGNAEEFVISDNVYHTTRAGVKTVMKDDIIRQVREAEIQAEQKAQEAKTHAEQILRDARHQAVELREEILEKAKMQARSLFETGAKGVEPEVERTKHTFQDDIANDTECARKNIEAVIESVVTTFHEQFGSE